MEKLRLLTAPKGSGSLLCCQLSPHDDGASLAVGGENATAAVFDVRGDNLVAHHLSALNGCFNAEDAVTSVAYNPARDALLYCASGCEVTAWDLRKIPKAAAGSAAAAGPASGSTTTTTTTTYSATATADDEGLGEKKRNDDDAAADDSRAASSSSGGGGGGGGGGGPGGCFDGGPVHRYAFNAEVGLRRIMASERPPLDLHTSSYTRK